MGAFFSWLTNTLGGSENAGRKKTVQWLLLLGLVGVGFMIASSTIQVKEIDPFQMQAAGFNGEPSSQAALAGASVSQQELKFADYERHYADALKTIMEKIVGVGAVEVLVTIDSTEEIVVERHQRDTQQTTQERDQSGATRHITDIGRDGQVVLYEKTGRDGGTVPLVLKTIKPQIRGVVVVASGAENPAVKKLLIDAVERGLAVPAHRISVVPRKQ